MKRARLMAVTSLVAAAAVFGTAISASSGEAAIGPAAASSPGSSRPTESSLRLVALGDSISTANGCPGCETFVDLYSQAIARKTGSAVAVQNLSVPGASSADLLSQVQADSATRAAVAQADILTVTIGFNDTPWGRGDDPCHVAPDFPVVKWDEITDDCILSVTEDYEAWLDEILATVTALRAGEPMLLRVTTVYNSVIGDHVDPSWDSPEAIAPSVKANAAFAEVQCRLAETYGGRCADVLHSINGPKATREARIYLAPDYTHMNQRGHRLTARVLNQLAY